MTPTCACAGCDRAAQLERVLANFDASIYEPMLADIAKLPVTSRDERALVRARRNAAIEGRGDFLRYAVRMLGEPTGCSARAEQRP